MNENNHAKVNQAILFAVLTIDQQYLDSLPPHLQTQVSTHPAMASNMQTQIMALKESLMKVLA
jgi:TRAP-type C4-dicarboxylate transport system substrate-binding protein